jgi:hypothetical protein
MKKIIYSLLFLGTLLQSDVLVSRGSVAVGVGVGSGSIDVQYGSGYNSNTYFIVGASVDYFVLNDLCVGVGVHAWLGEDPTLIQYTVPVTYYIDTKTRLHPYAGGFYRYSDYSGGAYAQDYSSLGVRGGVAYRASFGYFAAGYVYERNMLNDINNGYPEVYAGFVF